MALLIATTMHQDTGGNIVQNFATSTHNFAPSSIFSRPSLQAMQALDDEGFASVVVTQFIDQSGVHNVNQVVEFNSNKCTSVTFTLTVGLASARALCITQNFP